MKIITPSLFVFLNILLSCAIIYEICVFYYLTFLSNQIDFTNLRITLIFQIISNFAIAVNLMVVYLEYLENLSFRCLKLIIFTSYVISVFLILFNIKLLPQTTTLIVIYFIFCLTYQMMIALVILYINILDFMFKPMFPPRNDDKYILMI